MPKSTEKTDELTTLQEKLGEAVAAREAAESDLAAMQSELERASERDQANRSANRAGDESVTAMALLESEAEVRRVQGLLEASEGTAKAARELEQSIVVAIAVLEAEDSLATTPAVQKRLQGAEKKLRDALGEFSSALRERDAFCDTIGRRLADAGVPEGINIGRLCYRTVTSGAASPRPVPGAYLLAVDGDELSPRRGQVLLGEELIRSVAPALKTALREVGLTLRDSGVSRL